MTRIKRPDRNTDDIMVPNSRGVTVTQGGLRNIAKARRGQKRQAKERAKSEAERRNSIKSPSRVLKVPILVTEASVVALLEVY